MSQDKHLHKVMEIFREDDFEVWSFNVDLDFSWDSHYQLQSGSVSEYLSDF